MILDVVGLHANAATFEELHTLARDRNDESEQHRLYSALAGVRDPQLAAQAAKIALALRDPAAGGAAAPRDDRHAAQGAARSSRGAPSVRHVELLLSPFGNLAPLVEAQFVPQIFWNSMPLDRIARLDDARTCAPR